jgi:hypothetical protein
MSDYDKSIPSLFSPKYNNILIQKFSLEGISSHDILDLTSCMNNDTINPVSGENKCRLDYDPIQRVILISLNRVLLCRWSQNEHIPAYNELLRLGITKQSNLYEVAGCLFRSILWPKLKLWKIINEQLMIMSNTSYYRIGFHYRCGDHNYLKKREFSDDYCYPVNYDENSIYGKKTIGMAECGLKIIKMKNKINSTYSYITSDRQLSIHTIHKIISPISSTILGPKGCHIDKIHTTKCGEITIASWFMLTIHDNIIVQPSIYETNIGPYSGFSKYAAIYSLKSNSLILYSSCEELNVLKIFRETNQNWICH